MALTASLTPHQQSFGAHELIVSKTDLKGHITYANDVFVRVCGYSRDELMGAPHNIIRHPDMPGGVFKFLWDTITQGTEVFAFVKNQRKDGSAYWVLAHVTPSYDRTGRIVGFHSNRRLPEPSAVRQIEPIYQTMLAAEVGVTNKHAAAEKSLAVLLGLLGDAGASYDEFVWNLINTTMGAAS